MLNGKYEPEYSGKYCFTAYPFIINPTRVDLPVRYKLPVVTKNVILSTPKILLQDSVRRNVDFALLCFYPMRAAV
jgi:hypothetical protein